MAVGGSCACPRGSLRRYVLRVCVAQIHNTRISCQNVASCDPMECSIVCLALILVGGGGCQSLHIERERVL